MGPCLSGRVRFAFLTVCTSTSCEKEEKKRRNLAIFPGGKMELYMLPRLNNVGASRFLYSLHARFGFGAAV